MPDSSFPFPHLSPHRFSEKGTSFLITHTGTAPRSREPSEKDGRSGSVHRRCPRVAVRVLEEGACQGGFLLAWALASLSLTPCGGYGRALKAPHPLDHALFESYVPGTLLFAEGLDHAAPATSREYRSSRDFGQDQARYSSGGIAHTLHSVPAWGLTAI